MVLCWWIFLSWLVFINFTISIQLCLWRYKWVHSINTTIYCFLINIKYMATYFDRRGRNQIDCGDYNRNVFVLTYPTMMARHSVTGTVTACGSYASPSVSLLLSLKSSSSPALFWIRTATSPLLTLPAPTTYCTCKQHTFHFHIPLQNTASGIDYDKQIYPSHTS
jgi:hypothetical protein